MSQTVIINAMGASPPPHHAQAAHVAGRVRMSAEMAGVIAFHAFGEPRRSDLGTLATVTASRCAMAGEVRS